MTKVVLGGVCRNVMACIARSQGASVVQVGALILVEIILYSFILLFFSLLRQQNLSALCGV